MNYNVLSKFGYVSYYGQISLRTSLRKLEKTTTNRVGDGKKTKFFTFLIDFFTVCQLDDKPRYWEFYRASAPNFCQGGSYMDHHIYEISWAESMTSSQTQSSGVRAPCRVRGKKHGT